MRRFKGMSLVECLVALVILTISTLIIYMGFTISATYTKRGSDIRRTSEAAERIMEARISAASQSNGTGYIDPENTEIYNSCSVTILSGSTPLYTAQGRYIVVTVPFENSDDDESLAVKAVQYTAFVQDKSQPKGGG